MGSSLEGDKPRSFISGLVHGRMQSYKVIKDPDVALQDDIEHVYTRQFFNGLSPFKLGGRCNAILLTPDEHSWLNSHDTSIVLVPRLNDLEDLEHQLRKDNLDWGDRCAADSHATRNLDLTKRPYSTTTCAVLVLSPNHITRSPVLKVSRSHYHPQSQPYTKDQDLEPLYVDYTLGDMPYYLLHEDMRTVFTTPSPTSSHSKRTSLFALILSALSKISDYIDHHSEDPEGGGTPVPGSIKPYHDRLKSLEDLIMFLPPGHRESEDFGGGGDTRRSSGVFGPSPMPSPIPVAELKVRFEEELREPFVSRDPSIISLWDGESLGSGSSGGSESSWTETGSTSTTTRPDSLVSDFWMSSDDDYRASGTSSTNKHSNGTMRPSVDTGRSTVHTLPTSAVSTASNKSTVKPDSSKRETPKDFLNLASTPNVLSPQPVEEGIDEASMLSLEDGCSPKERRKTLRTRASLPILPRIQALANSAQKVMTPTRKTFATSNHPYSSNPQTGRAPGLLERGASTTSSVSSVAIAPGHVGGVHQHQRERSDGGMGSLVGVHAYSRSYKAHNA